MSVASHRRAGKFKNLKKLLMCLTTLRTMTINSRWKSKWMKMGPKRKTLNLTLMASSSWSIRSLTKTSVSAFDISVNSDSLLDAMCAIFVTLLALTCSSWRGQVVSNLDIRPLHQRCECFWPRRWGGDMVICHDQLANTEKIWRRLDRVTQNSTTSFISWGCKWTPFCRC